MTAGTAADEAPLDTTQFAQQYADPEHSRAKNGLGTWAFVTGILGLSIVAIVLGHLGLRAVKRRQASNRNFALAGTILGYVGLVLTAALVAAVVTGVGTKPQQDAYAQVDATNVANAVAESWSQGVKPEVTDAPAGYLVGDVPIPAKLDDHTVTFTGTDLSAWCVQIDYDGGTETSVIATADGGLELGATCPVE